MSELIDHASNGAARDEVRKGFNDAADKLHKSFESFEHWHAAKRTVWGKYEFNLAGEDWETLLSSIPKLNGCFKFKIHLCVSGDKRSVLVGDIEIVNSSETVIATLVGSDAS